MSSAASSLSETRAPNRGLVQDIGERLAPGPDDAERRGGRLDIGDARARRNQAEVGITNRRIGRGADPAGGIHDRHRHALAVERLQALFDLPGGVNRLDDRRGIGTATPPVRNGALRVSLDQADIVPGPNSGERKADGERALAGATLLGGQYDRLHFRSSGWLSGIWVTPHELRRILRRRVTRSFRRAQPDPTVRGSR